MPRANCKSLRFSASNTHAGCKSLRLGWVRNTLSEIPRKALRVLQQGQLRSSMTRSAQTMPETPAAMRHILPTCGTPSKANACRKSLIPLTTVIWHAPCLYSGTLPEHRITRVHPYASDSYHRTLRGKNARVAPN